MKKIIFWAVVVIIVVAVILAFTSGGNKLCSAAYSTCSTGCALKAKVNGFFSGFFCRIGCLWDNLGCVVKSWF